ncbi:MAG: hypothetical protein R3A78_05070 [Polyangiales bacterium]
MLAVLAACGGTSDGSDHSQANPALAFGLPRTLVAQGGAEPALFLEASGGGPPIGYIGDDVRVHVLAAPEADRIRIATDGPLRFTGYLAMTRLVARAQARGRLDGAPVYVGPADPVRIVGVDGPWAVVEASPRCARLEQAGKSLGPYRGRFPADALGAERPSGAKAPRAGAWAFFSSDSPTEVHDRPGGRVVAVIPPVDPPLHATVLKHEGEWTGIRFGDGPYLVGFVRAPLTNAPADFFPSDEEPGPVRTPGLPARLRVDNAKPLWRVHAGAEVRFGDTVVGVLDTPGYARELGRYPSGDLDAFVAIDDQVAIRGVLRANDVEALTPPPTERPAKNSPAAPAESL